MRPGHAATEPADIGDDCQIPGPFDVRIPTIPPDRISIGHLQLDRPVEWIGSPVGLSALRMRQQAILTVAGQRFTRTLTMTAYGMADPYPVTIGGRRLLISAMTYLQTWDPLACGAGPLHGPTPYAGDDCVGCLTHRVRSGQWVCFDSDPPGGASACNPVVSVAS